ncbi:hypothetical protein SAMN05192563_102470 [Paraburkholderia aspalathi]|uniref:Uncharacterized protein n=2 Tax=Paraburkholderia aspalathi TaxID=1324617 RepID=A0A1I7EJ82_9BURK|nr:hypothetical protein [Paraburkholderia aspalathi]SFU24000.1 hypothetical protein SAMN05192563_102470 [Paraburkholderia aspalathi]
MQHGNAVEYSGWVIHPVVTESKGDRFAAAATIVDRDGEERTVGVDGDFARSQEAMDRAVELAIAWIHRRRVVSDHYVRSSQATEIDTGG